MLVSGTEDGELCLWNMNSYNLQSTIKGKCIFFPYFHAMLKIIKNGHIKYIVVIYT